MVDIDMSVNNKLKYTMCVKFIYYNSQKATTTIPRNIEKLIGTTVVTRSDQKHCDSQKATVCHLIYDWQSVRVLTQLFIMHAILVG